MNKSDRGSLNRVVSQAESLDKAILKNLEALCYGE